MDEWEGPLSARAAHGAFARIAGDPDSGTTPATRAAARKRPGGMDGLRVFVSRLAEAAARAVERAFLRRKAACEAPVERPWETPETLKHAWQWGWRDARMPASALVVLRAANVVNDGPRCAECGAALDRQVLRRELQLRAVDITLRIWLLTAALK